MNRVLSALPFCVFLVLLTLPLSALPLSPPQKKIILKGRVYNAKSQEPVGWATVGIAETGVGVVCDGDGLYQLSIPARGSYTLVVRCVGFAPYTHKVQITESMSMDIPLDVLSIELDKVEVWGRYEKNKSEVVVGQEALQHIQPVSLGDILILLPGAVMTNPGEGKFKGVAIRQVGEDDNSSLGTGVIIDGAPLSNDAHRVQLQGLTGESRYSSYLPDRLVSRRSSLNSGIDLRSLSTNHYDRIEIEQGISSASEGNISSGAIRLHPKRGVAPLEGRAKVDPLYKLAYVGKGFSLGSEEKSSLHVGADIVDYRADPRERLERYDRATAQLAYSYHSPLGENGDLLDVTATYLQTLSVQNSRTDELIEELDQRYRTQYYRSTLSSNILWSTQLKALKELSLHFSLDYTYDLLDRKYFYVSGQGPAAMPISRELGLQEGEFLPTAYYSYYQIQNQPLNIYTKLSGKSPLPLLRGVQQTLIYGGEWSVAKNFGQGVIMDMQRPPYPQDNTFIWPRANYVIPALSHFAAYAEDHFYCSIGDAQKLTGDLGFRVTHMLNLPAEYALRRKWLLDPRLRLSWSYETSEKTSLSIRLGYGVEHKLPTLDYLYPDKVYRYFSALNAYYSDPARNHLMTYAIRRDPTNTQLDAMSNRKKELGLDLTFRGYRLSLTLFREDLIGGYAYSPYYLPISYPIYQRPIGGKLPDGQRPVKEDYYEDTQRDFTSFYRVSNAERIVKKGVEYRLRTPLFHAIRTQFEINGAYYHTLYTSSIPVMYRPDIIEFEQKYPYVGIYGNGNHRHLHRFNTNIWANTHIPEWGLMLTHFVQFIWFSKSYYGREQSAFPHTILDLEGQEHAVGETDIAQMKDPKDPMRYLNRSFDELYYRPNIKPTAVRISFKGSKQLGAYVRLSFFVDNLIDLSPKYKQKDRTTAREWVIPYFGLETSVQF